MGLKETRRAENEKNRFTLIFLAGPNDEKAEIELTYNWDGDIMGEGSRNLEPKKPWFSMENTGTW